MFIIKIYKDGLCGGIAIKKDYEMKPFCAGFELNGNEYKVLSIDGVKKAETFVGSDYMIVADLKDKKGGKVIFKDFENGMWIVAVFKLEKKENDEYEITVEKMEAIVKNRGYIDRVKRLYMQFDIRQEEKEKKLEEEAKEKRMKETESNDYEIIICDTKSRKNTERR